MAGSDERVTAQALRDVIGDAPIDVVVQPAAGRRKRLLLADMVRRVEISRAANERYLEALAVVAPPVPTSEILDPVQRRITKDGRPYRALRPLTTDESKLFAALLRGEHNLQGFRNVDIRNTFSPHNQDIIQRRRASGKATRTLRLLHAHRLIRKVSNTRYYRVTTRGHLLMATALKLRTLDLSQLAS